MRHGDEWRNKKTGEIYTFGWTVTNATNAQDGEQMVIYWPKVRPAIMFARETTEFKEKFEEV